MPTSENLRKLNVNQIVPILEHLDCIQTKGRIISIEPPSEIQTRCQTCHSTQVIIDFNSLLPTHQ